MNEATARRLSQATTGLALLSLAGAVAIIAWPPMFPCQDAPGHLTDIRVSQDPALFAEWLKTGFAPASQGFRAPTALLAKVLSPVAAAKVTLLALLGGLVWAFDGIARSRGGMRPVAWAAAATVFVGWYYAMGFFNFLAALTFGAIGTRLWAEAEERQSPGRRAMAAVFFAICSLAHVVTGGMFLVQVWVSDVLARTPVKTVILRGLTLVPAGLIAVVVALMAFRAHADLGAVGRIGVLDPPFAITLRDLFATALVSYSPAGYATAAALLVGVPLAAVAERRAGTPNGQRTATRMLALAWTALFLAIPMNAIGWHYASPRVLFFAYVLPACFVAATPMTRVWGLVVAMLAAGTTLGGAPMARAEGGLIADSVDTFGDEPVGRTFIVNYHPEGTYTVAPWARPNVGTGRYATWAGGVDPGLFANNPVRQTVTYARPMNELFPATDDLYAVVTDACRQDPECSSDQAHVARADCVAATAVYWDSVTLVATPTAFVERLLARGFAPQAPGVLRPRPSTIRYTLALGDTPIGPTAGGQLILQAAYPGTCGVIASVAVPMRDVPDDTPTLQLTPIPSGPVTARAFVDLDGNGQFGPGDRMLVDAHELVAPPGDVARATMQHRRSEQEPPAGP